MASVRAQKIGTAERVPASRRRAAAARCDRMAINDDESEMVIEIIVSGFQAGPVLTSSDQRGRS